MLLGEAFVRAVWADAEAVEMEPRLRAALRLCKRITRGPAGISSDDLAPLRSLGVDDRAIEQAIQICCGFNMIGRISDALDFDVPGWETFKKNARFNLKRGYV